MHPDDRERLLASLLAGDLQPDDPEAKDAMRDDPTIAAELAEMRELEDTYRRLGREATADLAAARSRPAGPRTGVDADADAVRRAMARHAAGESRRAQPMSRRMFAAAAAMLAVTVAVVAWQRHERDPSNVPHVPKHLGGGDSAGLAPNGAVDAVTEFSWSVPPALGRTFVVRVRNLAAPDQDLLRSPELEQSPWRAAPEQLARLPAAFEWQLVVRDADDSEVAHSASVTRHK